MYGMVNNAVEDLVVSRFGRDTWERIRTRAGVDEEIFISNEPYDDRITFDLVGAAVAELGLSADEVLAAFGEHWVLAIAPRGYGALLDGSGRSLPELLTNLNLLHTRVQLAMPRLRPPLFEVTDRQVDSLVLHYRSHRHGLTSFVVGLLTGLGKRFATPVRVQVLHRKDQGADHDVFHVHWSAGG